MEVNVNPIPVCVKQFVYEFENGRTTGGEGAELDQVAARIAAAVSASKIEQKELALRAKVPTSTLNQILRKGSGRFENVAKVARALNLTLDDLLDVEDAPLARLSPYDANPEYKRLIDAIERVPQAARPRFVGHLLGILKIISSESDVSHRPTVQSDIKKEFSSTNVSRFPERTVPRWTPEFPVEPTDFNDSGDADFPLELHAFEQEDMDEAGVDSDDMPTTLLSSREVKSSNLRTVRVRGNDVAPFEEGWKLAVDVTVQDVSLLDENDAVVAYRKDKGMWLGRLHRSAEKTLIAKDTGEVIDLSDGYRLVGPVDHVAYQPVRKRRGRG